MHAAPPPMLSILSLLVGFQFHTCDLNPWTYYSSSLGHPQAQAAPPLHLDPDPDPRLVHVVTCLISPSSLISGVVSPAASGFSSISWPWCLAAAISVLVPSAPSSFGHSQISIIIRTGRSRPSRSKVWSRYNSVENALVVERFRVKLLYYWNLSMREGEPMKLRKVQRIYAHIVFLVRTYSNMLISKQNARMNSNQSLNYMLVLNMTS